MKKSRISLALASMLLVSSASFADEKADIQVLKEEIKQLKETTQSLIDETSDLKTGFNYTVVDPSKSHSGLGAAASKVYYSKSPLSIGGYGEMYYANKKSDGVSGTKSTVDVYRFVPYIGYKFDDNIILNVELEFEHGGVEAGAGGEVIVEFMYLDFLINQNFNARAGHILVPMGLINERHEPTLFTTVQRPNTSKYLIPSTWHESGAMAYGNITDSLTYKAAVITGLDDTQTGYKWIRSGRGGSFKNTDPKLGGVARVDFTGVKGLMVGASIYADNSTTMLDVHADYKKEGFRAYGVYSQTKRSNDDVLAAGESTKAQGGFLNLSYDVLSLTNTKYSAPVFVQYETVDTHASLVSPTTAQYDAVNTTTVGVNFFPHSQVVLKADYAMSDNTFGNDLFTNAKQGEDIFSLSLGFIF